MQAMIDKLFPNMESEEQWTEILAYSAGAFFPVLLAAVGFMFGPIFTPYNNDLNFPGRAHYSLEAAGICLVVGGIISIGLLTFRYKAKKAEAAHALEVEEAPH